MAISREQAAAMAAVEALSAQERSELLALLIGQTSPASPRNPRARRRFLALVAVCVIVLLVWIVTLGLTLPPIETTRQWRLAWVGFDIAELAAFAATGWAAWRGRQLLIPALVVLGTLLFCDAWFDVVLSWSGDERWSSVLSAVFVEVPLAVLFWWLARRLVLAGVATARARLGLTAVVPALHRLTLFEPVLDLGPSPRTAPAD